MISKKNMPIRGNPILLTLTNKEIKEKHKELGSIVKVAKFYGISVHTAHRAVMGARQCPSLREGNLK